MGAFFKGALEYGGKVHGITHQMFMKPGDSLTQETATEHKLQSLEVVQGSDLNERKRRLLDAGDCLVALPGGVGTLDELFMAIGERGVGCGDLPILMLNIEGYYDGVIKQLQRCYDEGMLRKRWTEYVEVAKTADEAVAWCLKQQRRPAKAKPKDVSRYRTGVLHGVLAVAFLGLVGVAGRRMCS